jgi:CBS domain-containing protein
MGVELITAVVVFTALIAVVALRSLSRGRVEITLNDAIIAAIAAVLVLLVTGRITEIVVSSSGITAKMALLNSASRPIAEQVNPLPVAAIEQETKGSTNKIPEMVRRKVQGLDLILGSGGYIPEALQSYLETLTPYDFFRFVILQDRNGKLFGMFDARTLFTFLNTDNRIGFEQFTEILNNPSEEQRTQLAKLPGFISAVAAVTKEDDKRNVLERMEKTGRSWLPVINSQGQLEGIVEESRLTASMIIDVTKQLGRH